jgi:integrase/recombinase XerC
MTLREIQQSHLGPHLKPNQVRWLHDFKKRLTTQGLSETTIRGYVYDLQIFCEWSLELRSTMELSGLTETDLNAYRRFLLKEKKLKPNTVNRRLLSLKKAIFWAAKKGTVAEGIANSVRLVPKGEKRLPKALNRKEAHALLRAAGLSPHGQARRNYAVVQMLLQTGLRVSEVALLKVTDATLSERRGEVSVRLGKGEKERTVQDCQLGVLVL